MADSLPTEAADFKDVAGIQVDPETSQKIRNHNDGILKLESSDKKHKLWFRIIVAPILIALLIFQNGCVFYFVFLAYRHGMLEQASAVLSVICTATLVETAAIVHTMVKWVFSDVDYKLR